MEALKILFEALMVSVFGVTLSVLVMMLLAMISPVLLFAVFLGVHGIILYKMASMTIDTKPNRQSIIISSDMNSNNQ